MMPDISSDTMQSLRETNERRALTLGNVGDVSIFCLSNTQAVSVCCCVGRWWPDGVKGQSATVVDSERMME